MQEHPIGQNTLKDFTRSCRVVEFEYSIKKMSEKIDKAIKNK